MTLVSVRSRSYLPGAAIKRGNASGIWARRKLFCMLYDKWNALRAVPNARWGDTCWQSTTRVVDCQHPASACRPTSSLHLRDGGHPRRE